MSMTIDEIIEYERKQAKSYRQDAQIMTNMGATEPAIANIEKIAERHEKIAELLEELKCYRNDNDFSDYADKLHKVAFKSGYNKAIDDFAEQMKSLCKGIAIAERFIDETAEQLKAGGEND